MSTFKYNLGSFANDTLATADVVLKGWDVTGDPVEGMVYYDTTLNRSKEWDGTAWQVTDYKENLITVAPSGGDYDTLKAAMAAAPEYSTIIVYPPNTMYSEDNPLVFTNEHVSVFKIGLHETGYVDCQNAGSHGIVMNNDTEIFGLQVRNASGAGSAAFYAPAGVNDIEWHDCKWRDCDIGFLSEAGGVNSLVLCRAHLDTHRDVGERS